VISVPTCDLPEQDSDGRDVPRVWRKGKTGLKHDRASDGRIEIKSETEVGLLFVLSCTLLLPRALLLSLCDENGCWLAQQNQYYFFTCIPALR